MLSEVKETSFGLFTDDEKKNVLSVCLICSPLTLDSSFKPIAKYVFPICCNFINKDVVVCMMVEWDPLISLQEIVKLAMPTTPVVQVIPDI